MPTRKQRRRMQKERRHEYETVWVDGEGNVLDEPPDDGETPAPERRQDGKKSQQRRPAQRSATRIPQPPSWRRAIRRSAILGLVVIVFFYILNSKSSASTRLAVSLVWGVGYAALFIPFTYGLDRFAYRRWQRKEEEQPRKR